MKKTQEIETTYRAMLGCWTAVRELSAQRLQVRTSLRVRKLGKSMEPDIEAREVELNKILTECGAKRALDKTWQRTEEGEIIYATPEGRASAESQLEVLADTEITLTIIPLTLQQLEANDVMLQPALLGALEDAGMLIDEDEVDVVSIAPEEQAV